VIAGRNWGGDMQKMEVPPAVKNSIEHIIHNESAEDKLILLSNPYWKDKFKDYLGHRAIGVVYHPEYERGNYVPTLLPARYDALIHIDQSSALHPLHLHPDAGQTPETYPFGF
jgi:erythromycin esterase-like protein